MAPNLITLIGSLILFSGVIVILFFDFTLSKELPAWAYFYSGLSIFLYQTLDAVDGKQARRTGSSSPLGQLFDHGCDAFACTCLVVIGAQNLGLGNGYLSALMLYNLTVLPLLCTTPIAHLLPNRLGRNVRGRDPDGRRADRSHRR